MKISALALFSALAGLAQGHGYMKFPLSRVAGHSCAHCANGVSVCGNGRNSQWETSEAFSQLYGPGFRQNRVQLNAGGKLEIELAFTVPHYGVFVVELCDSPGEVISEDCFRRLERDPTDVDFSPYIQQYPSTYFLLEDVCQIRAGPNDPLIARYIVPADAKVTKHAILRWRWQTGNSCAAHEMTNGRNWKDGSAAFLTPKVAEPLYSWKVDFKGGKNCGLSTKYWWNLTCGKDCPTAQCKGEQFTNCADVAVVRGDKSVTSKDYVLRTDDPRDNEWKPPHTTTTTTTRTTTTRTTTTKTTTTTTTSTTTAAAKPVTSTKTPSVPATFSPAELTIETTSLLESTTMKKSPAGTAGAEECVGNGPVSDVYIEDCLSRVYTKRPGLEDYCRSQCAAVGGGVGTTALYCKNREICSVSDCVAAYFVSYCGIRSV